MVRGQRTAGFGFEFWIVQGPLALLGFAERIPDVLVLEPQLPWGGGDGVLAMMGEMPGLAVVPVMVLTSCRDPRVLEAVSRFPISDYQVKPLTPDRFAGRLPQLVQSSQTAFHYGRTKRPPGMFDRQANRRPGLRPARRDRRRASHCAWPLRLAPRQATWRWPLCWRRFKHRTYSPEGSRWILTLRRLMDGRPGDVPYLKQRIRTPSNELAPTNEFAL